jgi:hypothetical protein
MPVFESEPLEKIQPADPGQNGQSRAPSPAFRRCWAQWTAILAHLAARPDQPPCTEQAYRALHRAVLAGCSRRARESTGQEKVRFEELALLIQPWMSLSVMMRTDSVFLQDLARRARQNGRELGLAADSLGWLWLVVLALLVVGVPVLWQLMR